MTTLVLVASGLASPALAAPSERGVADARPHCVLTAVEVGKAGPVEAPQCFATFAEAVAEATDGAVRLPADATTVPEAALAAARQMNDNSSPMGTVIGIEFEHKSFKGWSYVIKSVNSRGCNGYSYQVPYLPASRNNAISSAQTFAGCKSSHYSGTYFTGTRYLCGCSQMGYMNDQTSSIKFSSTGQ